MKKNIHPQYYSNVVVKCGCGHTFTTGSILPQITVEVCSRCHPFYTGVKKLLDTEGRVEKFERIRAAAKKTQKKRLKKAARSSQKQSTKSTDRPKTLKDMLAAAK